MVTIFGKKSISYQMETKTALDTCNDFCITSIDIYQNQQIICQTFTYNNKRK